MAKDPINSWKTVETQDERGRRSLQGEHARKSEILPYPAGAGYEYIHRERVHPENTTTPWELEGEQKQRIGSATQWKGKAREALCLSVCLSLCVLCV